MARFVLTVREFEASWRSLTEISRYRLIEQYFEWVDSLKQRGLIVRHDELQPFGSRWDLSQPVEEREERPLSERAVVTNILIIEVGSRDEAVEIAQSCPALLEQDSIVISEATDI